MNAQLAFLLSVGANLLAFTLIVTWYVIPRLSKRSREEALLPLVLLNTFRTLGLTFLLPQVTGGTLPPNFAIPAAYGDLLVTVLALLAALALRFRPGSALPLVWLFNLIGIVDLLFAIAQGLISGLPFLQLGAAWFIPTVYVPLLLVIHLTVFWFLLRPAPSARTEQAHAAF